MKKVLVKVSVVAAAAVVLCVNVSINASKGAMVLIYSS